MAEVGKPSVRNQDLEVVLRLIKLTQNDKLKWSSTEADPPDDDYVVSAAFICNYNDYHLLLMHMWPRGDRKGSTGSIFPPHLLAMIQNPKISLSLVDRNGKHLWHITTGEILKDLLTIVRHQVADVKGFYDQILKEE